MASKDIDEMSEVDLQKCRRQRGGHRAYLRKCTQTVKEIISCVRHGDSTEINRLEGYKQVLKEKKITLASLDAVILDGLEVEEEIVNEICESSEFQEVIASNLADIDLVLGNLKISNVVSDGADNHALSNTRQTGVASLPSTDSHDLDLSNQSNNGERYNSRQVHRAKLPKLILGQFNGEPKSWQSFWESFKTAVHENTEISKVDKFNYLRSLLSGTALNCVDGMTLTGDNYDEAVKILNDRFANKQIIISSHIDALLSLPTAANIHDIRKLRTLYDSIEVHIRSLKSLGISSESYGTVLIPIILNKIPEDLRLIISRKSSQEQWGIDDLLSTFKSELEARERIDLMTTKPAPAVSSSFNKKFEFRPKLNPSTASTLYSSNPRDSHRVPYCVFCRDQHSSADCAVVVDISKRRAILRKKGKCFVCLRSGHVMKQCNVNYKCFKCGEKHNRAICDSSTAPRQNENVEQTSPKYQTVPMATPMSSTNMCVNNSCNSVLLQTAIAPVSDPGHPGVNTNILFDSCSQRTYVTEAHRTRLNLKTIGRENLLIKIFGEETPRYRTSDIVQLAVTCNDGMEVYVKAYCIPNICSTVSDQCNHIAIDKYPHLQGLTLANPSRNPNFSVDVLIGADYYWNFFNGDLRRGEPSSPVALNSRLGWIISGPLNCNVNNGCTVNLSSTHVLHISTESHSTSDINLVKNELSKFWDLETIGIRKDESSVLSDFIEDVHFNESFKRYEAKLPFKDYSPILSDGYFESSKRLSSLLYRLKKKPDVLQEYNRIINEQLNTGIISNVPSCHISNPGNVHYLAHREVLRPDKDTTKLRVVYDASAKPSGGLSLNDCLFAGPSLNPLIFDMLLRFRLNSIAVLADIEKAFLNILIAPEHRDFLRFLWVDDPFKDEPLVQVFRFNRVVFGVTSSPFILNATIRHHLNLHFPYDLDFVHKTLRSLYVDDFASGSSDVQSAFEMCKQVKLGLQSGGFNLRKWVSNSPDLMKLLYESDVFPETEYSNSVHTNIPCITEEDRSYSLFLQNGNYDSPSVLGQKWNCHADTFQFEFEKILSSVESSVKDDRVTKRAVLCVTAKFYDPVGLIAPIVLLFKLCFQTLCKEHLEWDDPLDDLFTNYWLELVRSLSDVNSVIIKRCICYDLFNDAIIELHVFGDSSERAYGCCAYIRCIHSSGEIHCNLIASKSRVVPAMKMTIPRLELLACLVSVRLANSIREALSDKIDFKTFYWSDSTVALSWIKNVSKEFKQFVHNRVTEIRRLSSTDDWSYIPSSNNPSDIVSRGCKAVDLINNELWWHGPAFLTDSKYQWLLHNVELPDVSEEEKTSVLVTNVQVSYTKISTSIDVNKYSSLRLLLRVTAYVIRFIHNLKSRVKGTECRHGDLTVGEITDAEYLWIKEMQMELRTKDKFQKQTESLNLKEDENGLFRCHGRLENSPLPYDTKFPILLDGEHYFTRLVIRECHERVYHNGVQDTLSELRARFWVVRGRQVVKVVIKQCLICRRLEGKSYGVPIQPQLPEFRVSDDFGFSKVGVDYAGPLYVKDIYSSSGQMNKVFIALFTCASTRAIHLDLVPDASSESFIRCFKRFIGRRGIPSLMISDNGKTFKSSELHSFLASKRIRWYYNIERSPWWGGFFERMVRSTKRCLKKTIGTARLSYEELLTLIVEIEGVLNSRPLTYVCEDGGETLTPSHLILGRRLLSQTNDSSNADDFSVKTNKDCRKRNSYLNTVLSHFRNRWRKDYLTDLRDHHRSRTKKGPTVNVGDVVVVQEDKVPRLNWSIARVEKTFEGRDGNIRAAEIRVHDKLGRPIAMNRPIQKLFPLELVKDN